MVPRKVMANKMNDKQIIKEIEKVLIDVYQHDDAHVADYIVGVVREVIGDPNFAKGATFSDEGISIIQSTPEITKNRPYK